MNKFIIFLPFSLLGGGITLLGGLLGEVSSSVLLIRSLLATIICAIVQLSLLFVLSKYFFQGSNLFARVMSPPDKETRRKKFKAKAEPEGELSTVDVQQIKAAASPFDDADDDELFLSSVYEERSKNKQIDPYNSKNSREVTEGPEAQLRSSDPKELAGLVRHSMNEE